MPTVTTVLDTARTRIRVDLAGFAPDGPVTVTGSDGRSSWVVRSITAVSGGVATGFDYEATLNAPVTYTVIRGVQSATSVAVTLVTSECAWLRAPGLPALDVAVEATAKPARSLPRQSAVLRPIGRRTAVTLSGALSAGEFTLVVRTRTDDEAFALEALVATSPRALLLMPGTRWARQYVEVSGMEETHPVHYQPPAGARVDDVAHWSVWSLPCVVIDRPAGGLFGDPSASYAASKAAYPTYAARKTAHATYLDALRGGS